jgi:hypothetical protein
MPFKTPCPACGNSLQVPDTAAGKRGRCPTCQHVWAIPRPTERTDPFNALCPACQNSLEVPGEAVGKRARCPVCQHVWVISRPVTAAVVAEQPKTRFDDLMDDVHPATLPQATIAGPAASRPRETVKLWRDGKYLVVDIHTSLFPAICVKTGEPTTTTTRIELAWVDRSKTWGVSVWSAFGPLGKLATMRAIERMKTKFSLRVGLSPEWLARRRIKRWIAWGVLAIGALVIVSQFLSMQPGKRSIEQPVGLRVAMVVGILVAVAGWMGLDYTSKRSVLGVYSMDGNYAWLVGVHRDFLDSMEPWRQ